MIVRKAQIVILLLVMAAGFGGVFAIGRFIETNRQSLPESYANADLALQGKRLKGFALGAEGLLADWYWINALQYLGHKVETSKSDFINIEDLSSLDPKLLYPYLDNATDLDPKFVPPYAYGALVLPAIDPSQAILLTEKGIANNPDQWRLYQYLGYIHWRLKNFQKASDVYERGSQVPGSPPFMKLMAALMKTQGGSLDTARQIYSQMLEQAVDQQSKDIAKARLAELDTLDETDAINNALKSFAEKNGGCPRTLSEILPLLSGVRLPSGSDFHLDKNGGLVDASGTPYVLDRTACSASIPKKKNEQ